MNQQDLISIIRRNNVMIGLSEKWINYQIKLECKRLIMQTHMVWWIAIINHVHMTYAFYVNMLWTAINLNR